MRLKSIRNMIFALAILLGVFAQLPATKPAKALCLWPQEDGHWVNVNSQTRSIVAADIQFSCQDVILNGHVNPSWYVHLYGACTPTRCDWGNVAASRDSSGWVTTTIDRGYAVRYVWVKAYSKDSLRIYIWTDFRDGRTDYASDDWFRRG